MRSYLHDLFHEPTLWVSLIIVCGVLLLAGCAHTVTAPLPAGALNTFDADSYRTLSDAHAAVQSIQQDASAGRVQLDGAQKQTLNKAIVDVNTADHAWKLYHSTGAGDTAGLTQAIQEVVADLAALTSFPKTAPATK
jgi:hypothetical protein